MPGTGVSTTTIRTKHSTISSTTIKFGPAPKAYSRLSGDVIPDSYVVCIKPNWDEESFEGCVIAHVTINTDIKDVVLHAVDMNVGKIMWEESITNNRQEPLSFTTNPDTEQLIITFEPPLSQGQGTLRMNFSGKFSGRSSYGLYKTIPSDYKSVEWVRTRVYFPLLTALSPIYARRCFPCWDEPTFKASFELSLIVPKNLAVFSTMPQIATYPHRKNKDLRIVEFMRTPPIHPSGLALAVADYKFLMTKVPGYPVCRVFTDPARKALARYCLVALSQSAAFFSNYLDTPFPLPKLDLIANADGAVSELDATSNWGIINCRDSYLLLDETFLPTPEFLQSINGLVARLVARQWFGNLATPEWHNGCWLHHGLASFLQGLAVNNIAPHFDIWPQFVVDHVLQALDADVTCSPALDLAGTTADPQEFYFYTNGGDKPTCIIRMLYAYVGPENFKKGLNLYLAKYKHGNSSSAEFFQIMAEVSELPVDTIFHTWGKHAGYPLLKVAAKQEGNFRIFTLTQEKCRLDYTKERPKDAPVVKDPLWHLPITFSSSTNPELLKIVMDKRTVTASVLIGRSQWVSLNPGHFGYYRVRYNADGFSQMLTAIRQNTLPVMERLTLLHDFFAQTLNGSGSTVELFGVLETLVDETHFAVWKLMSSIICQMDQLLEGMEFYKKFQGFTRFLYANVGEKSSFHSKKGNHLAQLRRPLVLGRLIKANAKPVIKEAMRLYDKFHNDPQNIPPDLKEPLYLAVLQNAEEDVIRHFFKVYRETESLQERDQIAKSFGIIKDHDKVKIVLDFSISEEVKHPHTIMIFESLSAWAGIEAREVTWSFFKDHWTVFRQRYLGTAAMKTLIKSVLENFATEDKAVEVTEFFRDRNFPGTDKLVAGMVERIRLQEAWIIRDQSFIQDYLATYN